MFRSGMQQIYTKAMTMQLHGQLISELEDQGVPYRIILTTQKTPVIVDPEDFEWLSKYKWQWNNGHVRCKGEKSYMHRMVLRLDGSKLEADHKNCIRHDNRKVNLRVATRGQNVRNRGLHRNNTTGFKGVYYYPASKRPYQAKVMLNRVEYRLGWFLTKEEAAIAYDRKALELHGEFARTNFPKENYVDDLILI